jgi:hypothetical protein
MRYQALATVTARSGALVRLTKVQAARTEGLVAPVDEPRGGWARVLQPFQFKAGETFETDMRFGKGDTCAAPLASKVKDTVA